MMKKMVLVLALLGLAACDGQPMDPLADGPELTAAAHGGSWYCKRFAHRCVKPEPKPEPEPEPEPEPDPRPRCSSTTATSLFIWGPSTLKEGQTASYWVTAMSECNTWFTPAVAWDAETNKLKDGTEGFGIAKITAGGFFSAQRWGNVHLKACTLGEAPVCQWRTVWIGVG